MKKAITIRIPEPCHEGWEKMTQTEKGKFCKVCTKEVIDFTNKTDEDLVKIATSGTNLCGRFKTTQLDRELKLERKSSTNFTSYAASLLLPLSLLGSVASVNSATTTSEKNYTSLGIGSYSTPNRAIVTITGNVSSSEGIPLNNVLITAQETGKTTYTDKDGNYSITTIDNQILVFHINGFFDASVQMKGTASKKDVVLFTSELKTTVMGKIAPPPIEEKIEIVEEKASEEITIKGTVTDNEGQPLPGANVIVKGTSTGTQTDFDGNYTLNTTPNTVLSFSYIGFETKEITLSTISNTISVQLEASYDSMLGEVVITSGIIAIDHDWEPQLSPEELQQKKEAQKQAYKNELEFKKIQKARKKAARQQKRAQKKNK